MFVWKSNQRRCNPYRAYVSPEGTKYNRVPSELYEEIADPTPPVDYSDETYYRTEQEDAPYVIFTKKSDEQLAQVRWSKLKNKRYELTENGGCKLSISGVDHWFHTDSDSKIQQLALYSATELPENLQWKTMSGEFIPMTKEIATQLFNAQMVREQTIFYVAESKKLDTSDINEGWPESYGEPT